MKLETFGERLVFSRDKLGINQKKLAEILGITPTRLNYWEKNKREPNVEMIKEISKILKVSGDFLIGIKDYEEVNNSNQIANLNSKEEIKQEIINNLDLLNELGHQKALERIDELAQIPKYTSVNVKLITKGGDIMEFDISKEESDDIKKELDNITQNNNQLDI